jgi:hypothetical protein
VLSLGKHTHERPVIFFAAAYMTALACHRCGSLIFSNPLPRNNLGAASLLRLARGFRSDRHIHELLWLSGKCHCVDMTINAFSTR